MGWKRNFVWQSVSVTKCRLFGTHRKWRSARVGFSREIQNNVGRETSAWAWSTTLKKQPLFRTTAEAVFVRPSTPPRSSTNFLLLQWLWARMSAFQHLAPTINDLPKPVERVCKCGAIAPVSLLKGATGNNYNYADDTLCRFWQIYFILFFFLRNWNWHFWRTAHLWRLNLRRRTHSYEES